MATFAERIRALRKQSDMTQEEVADRLNVTKQTISQYERGLRRPDMESLEEISEFFNVSTDYLLGKSDITIQIVDEEDLAILRDKQFRRLFAYYSALTPDGMKKLAEYIEDLNPKYFKKETDQ